MTVNMNENEQQYEAITTRNKSILVSAPAGSGKTKVLVDRIIMMLCNENISVNQLLVLTFTSAAAGEMKQRLLNALMKKIEATNDEHLLRHLKKQIDLLPNAYITNFHGFCSDILKQHGSIIQVSSDFTILENNELIINQNINQCLNIWLQDDSFKEYLDLHFNSQSLDSFIKALKKHYSYKKATFNYHDLIMMTKQQEEYTKIDQLQYSNYLTHYFKDEIETMFYHLYVLHEYCQKHNLFNFYTKAEGKDKPTPFDSLLELCTKIHKSFESKGIEALLQLDYTLTKSTTMSWKDVDSNVQTQYNNLKKLVIDPFKQSIQNLLYINNDLLIKSTKESNKIILKLDELVNELETMYKKHKIELNILDFNDLEQYSIELLNPKYRINTLINKNLVEIMIDEYQDTNLTQETIIQMISTADKTTPLFMVGDMKQAIYRFRRADPEIFKNKYDTFNQIDGCKRIDLVYNYRSNKIVLDSINYLMHQLMDQNIGGLEYFNDIKAPLNYDYIRKERQYNTTKLDNLIPLVDQRISNLKDFDTEILLIDHKLNTLLEKREQEAIVIANRISELIKNQKLENNDKELYDCNYKDIVVLMRSISEIITFKKIFDRKDIPNTIVLNSGFYESVEIMDCVHFLDTIYNCKNDLAFISCLTSKFSFSNFDEQLLITIKQCDGISFYDKTLNYLENNSDSKLNEFIDTIHSFIEYAKTHSIYHVFIKLLDESDYTLFISSLQNGKQRLANIELLIEKLLKYKSISYGEAIENIISESTMDKSTSPGYNSEITSNAVTFMTIHKSKGLEFPIVFISSLDKQFNKEDFKSKVIYNKLGFVTKPNYYKNIDQLNNIIHTYENPSYNVIKEIDKSETLDEEIRILYVALTRASQKIICTGCTTIENLMKLQNKVVLDLLTNNAKTDQNALLHHSVRKVNSNLDWILLGIMKHPAIIEQCLSDYFKDYITNEEYSLFKNNAQTLKIHSNNAWPSTKHAKFNLKYYDGNTITMPEFNKTNEKNMIETIDLNNVYPDLEKYVAVTREIEHTVTNIQYEKGIKLPIPANEYGTFIHELLEKIPFNHNVDVIQSIEKIKDTLSPIHHQIATEYNKNIQNFFNSELYKDIIKSKYIYKEKPISYLNNQNQIIHGILDLVYINETTITIVDYKTDRILSTNTDNDLINLHKEQLNYYASVLSKQFNDYTIEAYVYYLHINKPFKVI